MKPGLALRLWYAVGGRLPRRYADYVLRTATDRTWLVRFTLRVLLRAVLPATVAQELCLTGELVKAEEAHKTGIVREVVDGDVVARGLELGQRIAGLPRKAVLETKRRTLLERRHLWGFLFEDEQRVFRRALLGPDAVSDAEENGEAA